MELKRVFQKLTPTSDVNLTIYEEALNYVFEQPDVKNVAVSGAYGSGKSSVLAAYKKKHRDKKFLHISLAHFEPATADKGATRNEPIDHYEADIEGKVLNQLIHLIPREKIPRTNFKVKRELSRRDIQVKTAMFMLLLITMAYLGLWKPWGAFIAGIHTKWVQWLFLWSTSRVALLAAGIVFLVFTCLAVHTLVRSGLNRFGILKRVNIHGNGIELFEQSEDSYFDKYLNEVLYLFDKAEVDGVVFEDMDRYNSNVIFEKLRQVNNLVNSRKTGADKLIRFFYLLRDDVFVSKDRTKFFDFIMPVVPILDGSNAYDKFIEYFKKGHIYEHFDEHFMQKFSLYIDDIRLLKNIYNEFLIYHDRIQSTELDPNRLLALIVYKNVFPRDFSNLQLRKGFVYALFSSKTAIADMERQKILHEIANYESAIKELNAEHLTNIEELDALYFLSNEFLYVNNQVEANFPTRAAFIAALRANPGQVVAQNHQGGRRHKTLDNEFAQLEQNEEYRKRRDIINKKSDGEVKHLKSRIEKLRIEAEEISSKRLQDLITKENIRGIFEDTVKDEFGEEITKSDYFDLVKFLIRSGYIDETYPDYMTYFYPNSLSLTDKIFLRSVTDQVPKDYTYALKNPDMVVSRLASVDFKRPEILNFDLLDYLLNIQQTNKEYLTNFLQQLIDNRNYEFIGGYLARGASHGLFVTTMNSFWRGIFKGLRTEGGFSSSQLISYAIDTLLYSAHEDIQAINEDDCLTEFISREPTFLNIEHPDVTKLIDGFSLISVKFASLDYNVSDPELFLATYRNRLYELNMEQISLILHVVYGLSKDEDFTRNNYCLVLSQPDQPLAQYVHDNIEQYLDVVLANCGKGITDDEEAVLGILNNQKIREDQLERYMQALQTQLTDITAVDDQEIWSKLLENDCVAYSAENILEYFFSNENGMDSVLVAFINRGKTELKFVYEAIDTKFGDRSGSKFYAAVVQCSDLSKSKYESLLGALNRRYQKFTFEGIDTDKISVLIRLKVIIMNENNLLFLREHYPNNVLEFIVNNIAKYSESVMNENTIDLEELLMLLHESVADKYKLQVLRLTNEKISLADKGYSARVKQHVLRNNFDLNDLPFLFRVYPDEGKLVRAEIDCLAREHADAVVQNDWIVPYDLLVEMLTDQTLARTTRLELFATCLRSLSRSQTLECAHLLKWDALIRLLNGRNPTFAMTEANHKVLNTFKSRGWIKTLKQDGTYYRAYGRKT